MILNAGSVLIRHGAFYGPGTWASTTIPHGPSIHIDDAVCNTVAALMFALPSNPTTSAR